AAGHAEANRAVGADSITPVVVVGIAATGPAQQRNRHGFEGIDDIGTEAVVMAFGAVFTDPKTIIGTAAKMFGEVTVQARRDGSDRVVFMDGERGFDHGNSRFEAVL